MLGKFLDVRWDFPEGDTSKKQEMHYDPFPGNWRSVQYTLPDGRLQLDEWTYTAGYGWHIYDIYGGLLNYKFY